MQSYEADILVQSHEQKFLSGNKAVGFVIVFRKQNTSFPDPVKIYGARENDLTGEFLILSPLLFEEPSFHIDMGFTEGKPDNNANLPFLLCFLEFC